MDELIEYENMSKDELGEELSYLTAHLAEVIEERDMMLGQTGHHIPSTKLFKKYRLEIEGINERIASIKQYLGQR